MTESTARCEAVVYGYDRSQYSHFHGKQCARKARWRITYPSGARKLVCTQHRKMDYGADAEEMEG